MKLIKYSCALLLCALISSCCNDDDVNNSEENLDGQFGNVTLKFDNGVANQDFIFGTTYNKSNSESYKIDNLKYIVSNIRVKDSNGNTFIYSSDESMFVVNEANGNNAGEISINLQNIAAADYTEVTFGIGIDQERFNSGASGQGDFLATAEDEGMLWSWATGYKFIRLDGTFTSGSMVNQPLNIHMGSVGTSLDNYREVTLTLPNSLRVRSGLTPEIHIKADISKIFDGINIVNFSDGYDQVHVDANETPIISANMSAMFSVDHVHNE